jgi:hypothetical protein
LKIALKKLWLMNKEEKKERNQAKRAAKKEALTALIKFVKENTTDEMLIQAAAALTPGRTVQRSNTQSAISNILLENGSINEGDIFNQFKLGRGEMKKVIRNLIKKRNPEDRIWVEFDPDTGVYSVVGQGSEAPEGWTGYQPVTIEDMEIV